MYFRIVKWIYLTCFLCSCCFVTPIVSQNYYVEYSAEVRAIYKDIIDLKLDSVPIKIEIFKKNEPFNLARLHLENYLDFFVIFISEEEQEFKKRSKHKSDRLSFVKKNLDDSDPYKRFLLAEINLQWALTRSKFNQLFRSGREVYKAYNLLTENEELFPDFIYNKKSLSILHSLIETITIANVFKSILGLEGSIALAKSEIQAVIEFGFHSDFIFAEEADAIKALIYFYQANEKEEAWSFVQESSLDEEQSLLSVFLIAKLAQRIGDNERAIEVLTQKATSTEYAKFYYLDYQLGLSLLRKLDEGSKIYFLEFVNKFKGRHFIKEAYQKLAWASLIFDNDVKMYKHYMLKVESEGDDLVDDDKQAVLESRHSNIPNVVLLKSRLLFDGGYYKQAFDTLNNRKNELSQDKRYHAEFNYRLGRILQKLNRDKEAQKNFEYLVQYHSNDTEFYACSAALQLGLMAEKSKRPTDAIVYFEKCLSINPKSYKRSLHQKAKSGLERIAK